MPPKQDVRRLLKSQQSKRNKPTKITHPFAKYDDTNRLICIVCQSPVKSELVWQAHLGSAHHRENIQKLKALKEKNASKRASSPQAEAGNAKRFRPSVEESDSEDEQMQPPPGFFDSNQSESEEDAPAEETMEDAPEGIPEGFFDDPKEDARVRGALPPDKQAEISLQKDVEMFNEAMVDVTASSNKIQDEDDESFWLERNSDLIQEQAEFDLRVEKLKQLRQTGTIHSITPSDPTEDDEIKRELKTGVRQVLKALPPKKTETMFDDDSESESDEDDWREQTL
ncbi:hypothetical protein BDB01DRAFT_772044 [Pilobolus umbonatus]|nr:hypothetical protein BDB01DRAFT_772044 [Pilobolus umbonatus]